MVTIQSVIISDPWNGTITIDLTDGSQLILDVVTQPLIAPSAVSVYWRRFDGYANPGVNSIISWSSKDHKEPVSPAPGASWPAMITSPTRRSSGTIPNNRKRRRELGYTRLPNW